MIILVDMDGVIADWEGEFLRRWKAQKPEKPFIPLEDRRGFRVVDQYPEELKEAVMKLYHCEGFYRNLPMIEGADIALNEMIRMGHKVFICTSPLHPGYENCVLEKFQWLQEKLGEEWVGRIVLTRHKSLVKGDILIDDNPTLQNEVKPEWEQIFYDQPYNRDFKDRRRLTWKNWKLILNTK